MVGGRKTLYNNQPIDFLKKMVAASIKDGEVSTALRFCLPRGCEHGCCLPFHCFGLCWLSSISRLCGLAVMLENTSMASWASVTWMCECTEFKIDSSLWVVAVGNPLLRFIKTLRLAWGWVFLCICEVVAPGRGCTSVTAVTQETKITLAELTGVPKMLPYVGETLDMQRAGRKAARHIAV